MEIFILVSRDGFSRPVPRQPAHLHTQADIDYTRYIYMFPHRQRFDTPVYSLQSAVYIIHIFLSEHQDVSQSYQYVRTTYPSDAHWRKSHYTSNFLTTETGSLWSLQYNTKHSQLLSVDDRTLKQGCTLLGFGHITYSVMPQSWEKHYLLTLLASWRRR